jgi:two-component sensor histidine kinase
LLVLTFGRKELFKHLIILSTLLIITQIIIVIGLSYDVLRIEIEDKTENIFMSVNIVMSFISTMFITLLTVKEQLSHEERLRKATRDKELLLAEVFHRVKNNLNIVTSILNLKKNMSEDTSVQEAIEECRGRIYSMALVHETIFNNKREIGLKLDEYIKRLAIDISNGLGIEDLYHLEIEMDQVEINLTTAVPCGMIVNELLTNVFKHAKQKDQLLMINISLKKYDTYFVLTIQDNGPGMNIDGTKESLSLGMELIASLAEQMNTSGEFYTNNGLVFTMKVPIVG